VTDELWKHLRALAVKTGYSGLVITAVVFFFDSATPTGFILLTLAYVLVSYVVVDLFLLGPMGNVSATLADGGVIAGLFLFASPAFDAVDISLNGTMVAILALGTLEWFFHQRLVTEFEGIRAAASDAVSEAGSDDPSRQHHPGTEGQGSDGSDGRRQSQLSAERQIAMVTRESKDNDDDANDDEDQNEQNDRDGEGRDSEEPEKQRKDDSQ